MEVKKTELLSIKGSWNEVLNDCRLTANKVALDKEPSESFKWNLLISEHSPIRSIMFKWMWQAIKSWVATHWCRHKWECFISTRRTDRIGINRDNLPQSTLVDFIGEANTQSLIDTMRKRLCYQAADETRELAEDLKEAINSEDDIIGKCLVPNCIYRCGCPEKYSCGLYNRFLSGLEKDTDLSDIKTRYEMYDEYYKREKQG